MERLTEYEYIKETGERIIWCNTSHERAMERLAAYEDAEEQGRLVVLPCKVGTTVYVIKNVVSRGYPDPIIKQEIFEEAFSYEHLYFPKSVFTTYEEAEKALEERSGDGTTDVQK